MDQYTNTAQSASTFDSDTEKKYDMFFNQNRIIHRIYDIKFCVGFIGLKLLFNAAGFDFFFKHA